MLKEATTSTSKFSIWGYTTYNCDSFKKFHGEQVDSRRRKKEERKVKLKSLQDWQGLNWSLNEKNLQEKKNALLRRFDMGGCVHSIPISGSGGLGAHVEE